MTSDETTVTRPWDDATVAQFRSDHVTNHGWTCAYGGGPDCPIARWIATLDAALRSGSGISEAPNAYSGITNSPTPGDNESAPTSGDDLGRAIDAVADALNAWDQGEEPRPDTHRHWSKIVKALSAPTSGDADPLRELRALSEAATPGPWMAQANLDSSGLICGPDRGGTDVGGAIGFVESDAAFIVAAVNYVRAALAAPPSPVGLDE